ncbi:MAG: hypothetical protein ACRYG8_26345 [Janthinobacterium lividum]
MTAETDQARATLAAAIVVSRNAISVADITTALEDATFILHPAPSNSRYKAWQERNGLTPTTPEQDAERRAATEASVAAARASVVR